MSRFRTDIGNHHVVVDIATATRTHGSVQVLAPVSARVKAGQALVLNGPNGSGKSTLLRLIAGIDRPTTGRVDVLGQPASQARRSRRADLAVLLDGLPAYPDLTVAEHLEMIAAAWGARHQLGNRPAPSVPDALAQAGLTRVAQQYPAELSSGEAQMFALTCTLYRPGALVIVDEPEQRLDDSWRALARSLLVQARDAGRTVVVATHDLELRDALIAPPAASDTRTPRGIELRLTAPVLSRALAA